MVERLAEAERVAQRRSLCDKDCFATAAILAKPSFALFGHLYPQISVSLQPSDATVLPVTDSTHNGADAAPAIFVQPSHIDLITGPRCRRAVARCRSCTGCEQYR